MTNQTFEQLQPGTVIAEDVSFDEFVQRFEGQPVEWHTGKVIVKVSNNERHQAVLNLLQIILGLYLMYKQIGRLYPEGYPMYISDDVAARQPDLMIVLNEHADRIKKTRLEGAADVVIEVISPGTGSVDRGEKYYEYEKACVPEYWIIDPISEQIDIYALNDKGVYQRMTGTDDRILSKLLPGFVLDMTLLWQEELPSGDSVVNLVQAMVK
jgi:Uma2 family endonuclease